MTITTDNSIESLETSSVGSEESVNQLTTSSLDYVPKLIVAVSEQVLSQIEGGLVLSPERVSTEREAKYYQSEANFLKACRRGDIKEIPKFLESGIGINTKDKGGYTALHMAVQSGSLEAVRFLLENGADIEATSFSGESVLSIVLYEVRNSDFSNHSEENIQGVKKHVDVFCLFSSIVNPEGLTPSDAENEKISKIISSLQGTKFSNKTIEQLSFINACQTGNTEQVSVHIKRGIDVNFPYDSGMTALSLAIASSNISIVKCLLESDKIDINKVDLIGRTPLMIAVCKGDVATVKALLDREGIKVNEKSPHFGTAISILLENALKIDFSNHSKVNSPKVGNLDEMFELLTSRVDKDLEVTNEERASIEKVENSLIKFRVDDEMIQEETSTSVISRQSLETRKSLFKAHVGRPGSYDERILDVFNTKKRDIIYYTIPTRDHNRGFALNKDRVYKEISQLAQNYDVVFRTVDKIQDLDNLFGEVSQVYETVNRTRTPKYIFLNGHGNPSSLVFSEKFNFTNDYLESRFKGPLHMSQTTIVLNSCSTGVSPTAEGVEVASLAENTAKKSGLKVIAPTQDTIGSDFSFDQYGEIAKIALLDENNRNVAKEFSPLSKESEGVSAKSNVVEEVQTESLYKTMVESVSVAKDNWQTVMTGCLAAALMMSFAYNSE